jgi:hypothetical protein
MTKPVPCPPAPGPLEGARPVSFPLTTAKHRQPAERVQGPACLFLAGGAVLVLAARLGGLSRRRRHVPSIAGASRSCRRVAAIPATCAADGALWYPARIAATSRGQQSVGPRLWPSHPRAWQRTRGPVGRVTAPHGALRRMARIDGIRPAATSSANSSVAIACSAFGKSADACSVSGDTSAVGCWLPRMIIMSSSFSWGVDHRNQDIVAVRPG